MPFPDGVNRYRPSRLDSLQLAFSIRIAQEIVYADGVLDKHELDLLSRTFPIPVLAAAELTDERGRLLPGFEGAWRVAVSELPRVLTLTEKLDLVTLFHRTCLVDGELHPDELEVLRRAARLLEVPDGTLDAHLLHVRGPTLVPVERRRPR